MTSPVFKIFKYLFALALLTGFGQASAQNKYERLGFKIDSFANVGLPKSALQVVDQLDDLARKNNDVPQQIRAVIYRMTFQSYLEENALVAIITRLKTDISKAAYPVQPVLQSLLAQMYWNYYQQNRWQFNQRSRLANPDSSFTNWDLQTIITQTGRLYELSLRDAAREQTTPVGVLDGVLDGDKATRYLRPTLYDLLVQRAFDFFLSDEAGLTRPKLPFTVNDPRFFSGSREFANLDIKTTDTASIAYKGIKYLQAVTAFHLQKKDEEALADVDLKRLEFLYGKATIDNKDSLYLKALKQIATGFSAKPISSIALLRIGEYYQQKDSLKTAHSYFERASENFPNSFGGKSADNLKRQLEEKSLTATVEDRNAPDKPILGLLSYTNIKEASISIYYLSPAQAKLQVDGAFTNEKRLKLFNSLKPLQTKQLSLPDLKDFRKHSAEFKIDPLRAGYYVILGKDATAATHNLLQFADFNVTSLSYTARMNPDGQKELLITDRASGAPLKGVTVNIFADDYVKGKAVRTNISTGLSDSDGKYVFKSKQEQYAVVLSKGSDIYTDNDKYFNGILTTNNAADSTPQISTILFTDRQIYRPGQTIYFKALQISTLNGKSVILPNTSFAVNFNDMNYKQISSLRLQTNEFGSVQGSFVIPQNIANGLASISTVYGSVGLRIEEYKRPTFQAEFKPVTAVYRLNDSVKLKGTVTAFSGYGISQARVAIHITRRIRPSYFGEDNVRVGYRSKGIRPMGGALDEIENDTVQTNDKGEFEVGFKATPGDQNNRNATYDYNVNADVTDADGETQSANTNVIISNNAIKISGNVPPQIMADDTLSKIPLQITNLYDKPQKGALTIKVYALKGPGQVFKDRLWDSPDQFVLKREDFKRNFPGFAWQNEGDYNKWESSKLSDTSINLADTNAVSNFSLLNLKKQASGIYKIVINATGDKGDTTSLMQFVNLIGQSVKAEKMDDWAMPLVTNVNKGGQATFLVGINKPAHILMEKYEGAKLLSSEWLTINGPYQQKMQIPVPVTAKNDLSVQFLMVNDNRIYHSYQQIRIADTSKKLNVRFITYRDKLQPGEKEQWKLQITAANNKVLSAELLADLYDASLDDIAVPQSWQTSFHRELFTPNYFEWANDALTQTNETLEFKPWRNFYPIIEIAYEGLNLFGYDYYGGTDAYQNYLQQIADYKKAQKADKKIAEKYTKNAALVKNGYDISGRVISAIGGGSLSGVKINIKNTGISTLSNSLGYFKIKVPVNGILLFNLSRYKAKQISTSAGAVLTIAMETEVSTVSESEVANPGFKSQYSSADNSIAEPVGSSDAMVSQVKFPPSIVVADAEVKRPNEKVVMREIRTKPGAPSGKAPITPRTNFSETAFFYPQLHTNEKGEILIDFTIPEALTRWKFRGLATTRDLQTGYIENTVVTQKQLSISANMPRFLREGDTIMVSARLANLTDGALKGRAHLQLFNALNMQPVSLFADKADADQSFQLNGNATKAVSFRLVIPAGLDALTYRLTADAGQYTDGEENTLPVLPNRMLVTESMPMMVRPGQTKNFTFDKLVNQSSTSLQNKTLTLEYTQNPAWYAVQALPYMMEFPYECSEQVFSRFYANSLATSLVNKLPPIKKVFDQWKMANSGELLSNLEKNQELKATLIEETPWLKDAASESEQKKRIALLFDLNKMSDELKLNLDKLQKRQLPNGGFTWFGGNDADRYMTQHIAEGMGELYHLGIADSQQNLKPVADNAISYLDNQITADEKLRKKSKDLTWLYSDIDIHAWFTRSYFLDKPLTKDLKNALDAYLKWAQDEWTLRSVYDQGMIALTMQRYGKPAVTAQIEKSLLETAQQSDEMGMYWAKNQLGYFWYESPVETQSLLIELFTEAGNNDKAVDEMKIWLLRSKQTSNWKTTKATAAACYALLLKGGNLLADSGISAIKLGGKQLADLKPEVKADAGTGYIKTSWVDEQIKPALGKVEVSNNSTNISWGALHWQYLENLDKITSSQTNITLQRKYFIQHQTDAGAVLTEVDATHQPKTGDLLKVVVYLTADRDFEYVQLKDLRPAGTEPVDALSEYKYQDGLSYYQVTKDVATNFFISYLNKGSYVFEYRLRVAQPGNFSTGITSVQSVYAPEFNAHSQGGRLTVK